MRLLILSSLCDGFQFNVRLSEHVVLLVPSLPLATVPPTSLVICGFMSPLFETFPGHFVSLAIHCSEETFKNKQQYDGAINIMGVQFGQDSLAWVFMCNVNVFIFGFLVESNTKGTNFWILV